MVWIAQSSSHHNPSSFSILEGLIKFSVFVGDELCAGCCSKTLLPPSLVKIWFIEKFWTDNDLNKGILGQLSTRQGIIQEGDKREGYLMELATI